MVPFFLSFFYSMTQIFLNCIPWWITWIIKRQRWETVGNGIATRLPREPGIAPPFNVHIGKTSAFRGTHGGGTNDVPWCHLFLNGLSWLGGLCSSQSVGRRLVGGGVGESRKDSLYFGKHGAPAPSLIFVFILQRHVRQPPVERRWVTFDSRNKKI